MEYLRSRPISPLAVEKNDHISFNGRFSDDSKKQQHQENNNTKNSYEILAQIFVAAIVRV